MVHTGDDTRHEPDLDARPDPRHDRRHEAEVDARPDPRHDPGCELCEAARLSPWFHEDDTCWVAECEACSVPMVVWRPHGVDPSEAERRHMLERLDAVATDAYGEYWLDDNRRSIPGHWHVHARPKGRFHGR